MDWQKKIQIENMRRQFSVVSQTDEAQALSIKKSLEEQDESRIEYLSSLINQMDLSKSTDSDIEKALDISRLRRVRQMITRRDGTVYMKTVYKKLEEVDAEKRTLFNKQMNLEQEIDSVVGQRVSVRWKGEFSNTQYETNEAVILDYNKNTIRVKLTAPFHTNNNANYTYAEGYELIIPRVETERWKGDRTISKIEVAPAIHSTPQSSGTHEITQVSEASVGDRIEVTQGGVTRVGEITYIYTPREGATYQSAAGRTPKFKVKFEGVDGQTYVNPSSNRNVVKLIGQQNQIPSFRDMVTQLRAEGVNISLPSSVSRIQDGEETYTERVRVDRFGNENRQGRSEVLRTRTRPVFRATTQEERNNMTNTMLDQAGREYGKFNLVQFRDEFKQVCTDYNLNFSNSNLSYSFHTTGFELSYTGSGVTMTRQFSKRDDGSIKVYHSYFKVPSSIQGGGFMKKTFQSLYKQYKSLGVTHLSVTANINVGGYTWAKCGFRSSKETAYAKVNRMESLIGVSKSISKTGEQYTPTREDVINAREVVDSFYRTHSSDETFPMRLLAAVNGSKAGKATLLGTDRSAHWSGSIDLYDPHQKSDFETYIYNT